MKKQLHKSILIAALATFGLSKSAKADWTIINSGLTDKTSNDIASNGSTLFSGTDAGIFVSGNSGATWALKSGTAYAKAFAVSGTTVYAAIQDGAIGVAVSTDNGVTWTPVNSGLLYKYNDALAVDGSNVFTDDYGSTYVSANQGATWTTVSTLPGFSTIIRNGSTLCAGYSTGGNGYNGIYTSTDNGATWSQPTNTGLTTKVHQLAVIGTTLFASTATGVFTSTNNGATWTPHNITVGNAIAFAVSGTNLFIGTPAGVYLSTDLGVTYSNVSGIIGTESAVCLTIQGSSIFCGTAFNTNGIYKRPLTEMITVGVASITKDQINANFYPNPASSIMNLELGVKNQKVEVKLADMLGNVIKYEELIIQNEAVQLNLNNLSNGTYFVNVRTIEGVVTKKIIISK